MGIELMSVLPQMAPAPASADHASPSHASDSARSNGDGFGGMLASITAAPKRVDQPQRDQSDQAVQQGSPESPAKEQLQHALSSLAGAKVDLNAPGLGLNKVELQRLLANLRKLLKGGEQEGAQLLASLLAASQLAATQPADLADLTKLLGTSAQGTVSDDALASNLHLLVQSIQLMADSDGKMTLLQAVQELTPPGDAFTQQLATMLEQGDKAAIPIAVDTGPPKENSPGDADTQASATAGSNGQELTVTPTGATSPADGAAQEASTDIKALAQALEDLLKTAEPKGQPGSQAKVATPQASQAATVPAVQPAQADAATQLAQMAPNQPTTPAKPAAKGPTAPVAGTDTGSPLPIPGSQTADSATEVVTVTPQGGHDQADSQGSEQSQQDTTSNGSQGQPQTVTVVQAAPATFASTMDVVQATASEAPARPAGLEGSILDQVVQNATLALRNGEQEFRIQLKPDFLGAMEVRVSMDSGTVSVRMSVESAATRQLIDNNIGQLRQAFGTDQVRVEHVPSFASSDTAMSFNQDGQQSAWTGYQGQQGPLPEAIPYSGEAETDTTAQPVAVGAQESTTPARSASGLVDLQA